MERKEQKPSVLLLTNPHASMPVALQEVLADEGYQVVITKKMLDAWDILLGDAMLYEPGDKILAVVINFLRDTTLSGFDMASAIRGRFTDKKIILLTPADQSKIAADPNTEYFDGVVYAYAGREEMVAEIRRVMAG